jgi:hypothetical protein
MIYRIFIKFAFFGTARDIKYLLLAAVNTGLSMTEGFLTCKLNGLHATLIDVRWGAQRGSIVLIYFAELPSGTYRISCFVKCGIYLRHWTGKVWPTGWLTDISIVAGFYRVVVINRPQFSSLQRQLVYDLTRVKCKRLFSALNVIWAYLYISLP